MNSFKLFTGSEGCTAITLVATVIRPTGVRSRCSQPTLSIKMWLATW